MKETDILWVIEELFRVIDEGHDRIQQRRIENGIELMRAEREHQQHGMSLEVTTRIEFLRERRRKLSLLEALSERSDIRDSLTRIHRELERLQVQLRATDLRPLLPKNGKKKTDPRA